MQLVMAGQQRFCVTNVDLTICAVDQKQFRSAREKFRRAAFVGLNVRTLVTDHALERFAQLRERQRVRCRAGENKINIAVALENSWRSTIISSVCYASFCAGSIRTHLINRE